MTLPQASSLFFIYIYNNRVICLLIKLLKVKNIKKKKVTEK